MADPNVQTVLDTIGATLVDFNERFKSKDDEIAELKKEGKEANARCKDAIDCRKAGPACNPLVLIPPSRW